MIKIICYDFRYNDNDGIVRYSEIKRSLSREIPDEEELVSKAFPQCENPEFYRGSCRILSVSSITADEAEIIGLMDNLKQSWKRIGDWRSLTDDEMEKALEMYDKGVMVEEINKKL